MAQACLSSWFSCVLWVSISGRYPCGLFHALLFKFPYLLVLVSLGSDPCSSFSGKEDSSFTNALRFSPLHSGSSLGKYPISFGSFSGLLSTWIIEKYRDSEEY